MSWNPFSALFAIQRTVNQNQALLREIDLKASKIMSQDASIEATAVDLETDVQALQAAFASMAAAFAVLQQDIADGTASVSAATMAALQQAQSDIDAAAAAGTAQAASETAAEPPSA
jgi:peptidoglycan hydrolase CwlO-like protein